VVPGALPPLTWPGVEDLGRGLAVVGSVLLCAVVLALQVCTPKNGEQGQEEIVAHLSSLFTAAKRWKQLGFSNP
jgi:hypothetical protein